MKHNYKTNTVLLDLISALRTRSRENEAAIWRDIASRLERPARNFSEVNLSKIDRYTKEDELLLIPGKVLGSGDIGHRLTVAALGFSGTARKKIAAAGGTCLSIEQLMDINPKGSGVRIIG